MTLTPTAGGCDAFAEACLINAFEVHKGRIEEVIRTDVPNGEGGGE